MPKKPIAQLSIEEVRLVVERLHERVPMPQFELQTDQQFYRPGWGADGPTCVCCRAEIRPIKRISGVVAQYTDDAANADTLMAQTARRALLDALERMGLPTNAVDVPSHRGEYIPKFKRGACGCGRMTWHTEDIMGDAEVPGEWFYSWPIDPVPEGTYCSECGSLLGPEGWALLAASDPKAVQWPKEVSTEPDRAACTGATADSEDDGNQ